MTFVNATEDIISSIGETASYCPQGGGTITTLTVVFDRSPQYFETEDGSTLHYTAMAIAKSSDLPVGYAAGDMLTVSGNDYVIKAHEVDGLGEAQLMLSLQ